MADVKTHPVQYKDRSQFDKGGARVSEKVTLKAYEVYRELHGDQLAMITNGCRGGFGVGEIVAFLYAHNFPKAEWRARVEEAFDGMRL